MTLGEIVPVRKILGLIVLVALFVAAFYHGLATLFPILLIAIIAYMLLAFPIHLAPSGGKR